MRAGTIAGADVARGRRRGSGLARASRSREGDGWSGADSVGIEEPPRTPWIDTLGEPAEAMDVTGRLFTGYVTRFLAPVADSLR
jgi:hypothetical protein